MLMVFISLFLFICSLVSFHFRQTGMYVFFLPPQHMLQRVLIRNVKNQNSIVMDNLRPECLPTKSSKSLKKNIYLATNFFCQEVRNNNITVYLISEMHVFPCLLRLLSYTMNVRYLQIIQKQKMVLVKGGVRGSVGVWGRGKVCSKLILKLVLF